MSGDLILPIIGAMGGLMGAAEFIRVVVNSRSLKSKGEADAATQWSQVAAGANEAAAARTAVVEAERDEARSAVRALLDLCQDAVRVCRAKGGTEHEELQNRLDDIRWGG